MLDWYCSETSNKSKSTFDICLLVLQCLRSMFWLPCRRDIKYADCIPIREVISFSRYPKWVEVSVGGGFLQSRVSSPAPTSFEFRDFPSPTLMALPRRKSLVWWTIYQLLRERRRHDFLYFPRKSWNKMQSVSSGIWIRFVEPMMITVAPSTLPTGKKPPQTGIIGIINNSTWNWTLVSWTIGEHSTYQANCPVINKEPPKMGIIDITLNCMKYLPV